MSKQLRVAYAPVLDGPGAGVVSLGPTESQVETMIETPEGFTPYRICVEPLLGDLVSGLLLGAPALRSMFYSMVVSVFWDAGALRGPHPVIQAPIGGFAAVPPLPDIGWLGLTGPGGWSAERVLGAPAVRVRLNRFARKIDNVSDQDVVEHWVEHNETWRFRVYLSGVQLVEVDDRAFISAALSGRDK